VRLRRATARRTEPESGSAHSGNDPSRESKLRPEGAKLSAMKYEKTQRGNPHRLTIKQHVMPARSIRRFANAKGCVDVQVAGNRQFLRLKPNAGLFWTRRTWDERAERIFKKIEDEFQALADKIVLGHIHEIEERDAQTVNRFYALWYQRSRWQHPENPFIQMRGVTGSPLTKDQQEILEKKGIYYVRRGGTMPARFIAGTQLQLLTGRYAHQIGKLRWGIVRPLEGEFVMPDVPSHTLMPVAPQICLAASHPSGMITVENLRQINAALVAMSRRYFFARDLRVACAGLTWADIKRAGEASMAA
jgi:hypothetical protein